MPSAVKRDTGAESAPVSAGAKPDRRTIWRRRIVLMASVGLLVAVPVTIFASGEAGSPTVDDPAPIEVPDPELRAKRVEKDIGISMRMPAGWTRHQKAGVIELRSTDRTARVAISSPGPAEDAAQLHAEVMKGLRSSYREFDVARNLRKAPIGGLTGSATVASGKVPGKNGAEQQILVATAEGKNRAYLVVVFTGSEPSPAVVEAQALVNNLRFTK